MNYLKFAGFSFLAVVIFWVCAFIFDDDVLSALLALIITGAGFAYIKPAHFKFGYALWIAILLVSYAGVRWLMATAIRAETAAGNPYAFLAGTNYFLWWLAGCALSNPVCYWFGRRLANFLLRGREVSSLAEHFD